MRPTRYVRNLIYMPHLSSHPMNLLTKISKEKRLYIAFNSLERFHNNYSTYMNIAIIMWELQNLQVLSKKKRDEENLLKSDVAKTPRKSSDEDELQISSPTLLSRTTSRISPTVDFYTSMPCFSMSGASTPTTPGTPISDHTPNLFKVASKRNTTPIIFSQSTSRRKPQPIEKKLECTLEELCHGCVKKVMITRDFIATTGYVLV